MTHVCAICGCFLIYPLGWIPHRLQHVALVQTSNGLVQTVGWDVETGEEMLRLSATPGVARLNQVMFPPPLAPLVPPSCVAGHCRCPYTFVLLIPAHTPHVDAVCHLQARAHPTLPLLATCHQDGLLQLFDLRARKCLGTPACSTHPDPNLLCLRHEHLHIPISHTGNAPFPLWHVLFAVWCLHSEPSGSDIRVPYCFSLSLLESLLFPHSTLLSCPQAFISHAMWFS